MLIYPIGCDDRVYAIDARDGSLRATFNILDSVNCDWEDISVGPGPDGDNYIYVGDIGGNVPSKCETIYRYSSSVHLKERSINPYTLVYLPFYTSLCLVLSMSTFQYVICIII